MPQLKQCLGVDLGVNSVKIVELSIDKNSVTVLRAASAPTNVSPAMSPDETRQAIVAAARDVLKKGRFSARKAIFSISGQKVFIRRFRLPATSDERLARIIQYEARQQIPFPLDKTILQYQHRSLPDSAEVEVLLVAVRTDEVRDFMTMVNRTGLTPIAISVSSFALYNAHHFLSLDGKSSEQIFEAASHKKKASAKPKKPKKGKKDEPASEEVAPEEESAPEEFVYEEVKGFVNIGAAAYDLAIGRVGKPAGNLMFVRTVPTGGDDMTKAVMRATSIESFHDADRIKTSSTQLLSFNFDFEGESQVNQEASSAVTEVADRIIGDIRRSLDFFITQPDGMAIDTLVLTGGQVQLPGFDSYFEEKLTIPVSVVKDIPETAPIKWQQSAGPVTPYMIALGLGLQGLELSSIRVDFLPEERKIIRDFPYRVTAVMVLLLLVTIVIATMAGKDYTAKYLGKEDEIKRVMEQQSGRVTQFTEAQALQSEVATDYEKLAKSFGQRTYWLDVLQKIAEVKPPELLIEDIQMDHSGQVRVVGSSEIQVSATDLLDGLKKAYPDDLDVALGRQPNEFIDYVTEKPRTAAGQKTTYQFQITFRLKSKINHLGILPTPTPAPTFGANPAGGGGIWGEGIGPAAPQVRRPATQPGAAPGSRRGARGGPRG
ncbi:type IV pilus assembly protein PilM [Candidatus Sumerlaeota bacterium]|nr:type IV pilus assembly protein PilM [Candidatus Sumerlaeota bacterium]